MKGTAVVLLALWNLACSRAERPAPVLDPVPVSTSPESSIFPLNGGHYPQFVVGQDGGISVDLRDGRVLWFFGDTALGYSPDKKDIIRFQEEDPDHQAGRTNTAAILRIPEHGKPFALEYYAPTKGLKSGEPMAGQAFPYAAGESFDAGDRVWPGGGVRVGDYVYVFMGVIGRDKSPRFSLCRSHISAPLKFERLMKAPNGNPLVLPFGRGADGAISEGPAEFACSPWVEGSYLYCFATYHVTRKQWQGLRQEKKIDFPMGACLLRVPVGRIDEPGAWTLCYGKGRWGRRRGEALPFFAFEGHSVSVHRNPYLKKWVAAYGPVAIGSFNDSLEVVASVADAPWGPWSNAVTLFRAPNAPKPAHEPAYPHATSNLYIAQLHPWSSPDGGRTMLLTFNDSARGGVCCAWVDLGGLHVRGSGGVR